MSDKTSNNEDATIFSRDRLEGQFSEFLERLIEKVDDIVEIDPDLSEREIFEEATHYIVEFLNAHHASVRIYDPQTEHMLSFGSYPSEEYSRETYIPLEGSIAGKVVTTREPVIVPNILKEKGYQNKEVITKKGVNSLMGIPLEIHPFFPRER